MKKLFIITFIFLSFITPKSKISAFEITSDPQFVIMNFSEINELNWAAPEELWTSDVKPKIISQIHDMRNALPLGTPARRLAWSTLMEYMNFPLDTAGPSSPYVVKLRRILNIAEEENIPVFIPLNGFQWWDELPELYNWWDPDGTKTPASFFSRQETKDFRERFIKGFNPENKWNVEWQDWETPMKWNWRNWGGGGFVLAPAPNLMPHSKYSTTYRQVVEDRFIALVDELNKALNAWEKSGKQDLFAGISIGTEVSLSASITSADEYHPYGYRGIQDFYCSVTNPNCGKTAGFSEADILLARQEVVFQYFDSLARLAIRRGIPKQRLYTHVGEFAQGDERFFPYQPSAFTLYARPGISLYAFAQNPFKHQEWLKAMQAHGFPAWGSLEYSTDKISSVWNTSLTKVFSPETKPASLVNIYNWDQHKNTGAITGIAAVLNQPVAKQSCSAPEILPQIPYGAIDPQFLSWKLIYPLFVEEMSGYSLKVHLVKGINATWDSQTQVLAANTTGSVSNTTGSVSLPKDIYGLLNWYVEAESCGGKSKNYSEPRLITVTPKFPQVAIPFWVRFYLGIDEGIKKIWGSLRS